MMKKIILVVIMFMLFMGVVSASSINGDYNGSPIVNLLSNGVEIQAEDVPAIIYNNRTVVPIYLLKKLGINTVWDSDSYSVDIQLPKTNEKQFNISDAASQMKINGIESISYSSDGQGSDTITYNYESNVEEIPSEKFQAIINNSILSEAAIMEIIDIYGEKFAVMTKNIKDFNAGKLSPEQFGSTYNQIDPNSYNPSRTPKSTPTPTLLPTPTPKPTLSTGEIMDPMDSTPDTIETKMDGTFEGWEGETIFKLANGQIWQQVSYAYTYHYAYRPDVLIYKDGSVYKMKVDGVEKTITVKRLK